MHALFRVLYITLQIWVFCAIARALLSWFPITPGTPVARINSFLVRVTEPFIAPVRRVLPPVRAGGMGIDLSFIVVILAVQLIFIRICRGLAY